MKPVKRLKELDVPGKKESVPTLAVAAGQDPDTILAVARAVKQNTVNAVLVGEEKAIRKTAGDKGIDPSMFTVLPCSSPDEAAVRAVGLIREGKASMLMKGLVKTASFMKAILNKNEGLLAQGELLSHVAVVDIPTHPRLLVITDAAIVPLPDLDQKAKMLSYAAGVAKALGIENPKAAVISASESVSPKIQSSMDAAVLTVMAQRKQIPNLVVDGPLALDVAISAEHCEKKGLHSTLKGDADILLFPNIESANTFYKCSSICAGAEIAAVVVGTDAPVVLTSRADSEDSKFYSIALAARMAMMNKSV